VREVSQVTSTQSAFKYSGTKIRSRRFCLSESTHDRIPNKDRINKVTPNVGPCASYLSPRVSDINIYVLCLYRFK
jgi:hypothetical protein